MLLKFFRGAEEPYVDLPVIFYFQRRQLISNLSAFCKVSFSFQDGAGNITIEKQRNGTLVNNTYDDLNRLISRSIQRATGVEDTTEESYGYDGLSRLTRAQDNDALVNLKYTSLGRIKEETQNGKNVLYTYTKDGLRNSIKYPNGRLLEREFDDLNRLSAVKEDNENIVNFNFIGSALSANGGTFAIANIYNLGRSGSRLLNKKFANGDIVTYGYDQAKRMNHIETKNKNSEIINDYVYGYNKLDLKTFEKRNHENGQGDVYTYDELKRLIGVKYDSPEPENQSTNQFARSREYALDRVDNITKMVDKQNEETNETLIEKSGNCFKMNQYSKFGTVVVEYDQNGNMTRKGNQRFYYNYRNQLVRITEGEMEIGYKYDALGRRIERNKGADTEKYYYSDNQVIEERNGTDQVMKQYVYGNGIDEAIQLKIVNGANAGDYYYHTNGLGSTTAITDGNGALIERVKYDVYGTPMFTDAAGQPLAGNQSAISNKLLFQGREYDQDAGLYYFRARYYDPALGRFMQTDPIGYQDSLNLYQSFKQNPINFIDPTGKYFFIPENDPNRNSIILALTVGAQTSLGSDLFWQLFNDPRQILIESADLGENPGYMMVNGKAERISKPVFGQTPTPTKFCGRKTAAVKIKTDWGNIKKYGGETQNNRFNQSFDVSKIPIEQVSAGAGSASGSVDPYGVTTIYHELYHARTLFTSSEGTEIPWNIAFSEALKEDLPFSETGSAQHFGEQVFLQLSTGLDLMGLINTMRILDAAQQSKIIDDIWKKIIDSIKNPNQCSVESIRNIKKCCNN